MPPAFANFQPPSKLPERAERHPVVPAETATLLQRCGVALPIKTPHRLGSAAIVDGRCDGVDHEGIRLSHRCEDDADEAKQRLARLPRRSLCR
eukprot:7383094-Prymnesium_polylepis.2